MAKTLAEFVSSDGLKDIEKYVRDTIAHDLMYGIPIPDLLGQHDTTPHTKAAEVTDSSEGTKQEGHRNTQASQTTDTDNNKGNKGTEEAKSIE